MQGCVPIFVPCVHSGSCVNKRLHNSCVPFHCRKMQRRSPIPGNGSHIRASPQQHFHTPNVPFQTRMMQRTDPILVSCIHSGSRLHKRLYNSCVPSCSR